MAALYCVRYSPLACTQCTECAAEPGRASAVGRAAGSTAGQRDGLLRHRAGVRVSVDVPLPEHVWAEGRLCTDWQGKPPFCFLCAAELCKDLQGQVLL